MPCRERPHPSSRRSCGTRWPRRSTPCSRQRLQSPAVLTLLPLRPRGAAPDLLPTRPEAHRPRPALPGRWATREPTSRPPSGSGTVVASSATWRRSSTCSRSVSRWPTDWLGGEAVRVAMAQGGIGNHVVSGTHVISSSLIKCDDAKARGVSGGICGG